MKKIISLFVFVLGAIVLFATEGAEQSLENFEASQTSVILTYVLTGLGFIWGYLQYRNSDKSEGFSKKEKRTALQGFIITIICAICLVYYTDEMTALVKKHLGYEIPIPALLGFILGALWNKLSKGLAKLSKSKK